MEKESICHFKFTNGPHEFLPFQPLCFLDFLRQPLIHVVFFPTPYLPSLTCSPSSYLPSIYLPCPHPFLFLSLSPFGLNSWCTIFVSMHCSLPGLPFSLSLFISCLLALLLRGQSIRVIGQLGPDPRGRGVERERERRCEKERERTQRTRSPRKWGRTGA